ncbi:MAG: hypothetical protein HC786_03050 [Richelia sp. CSU_2_1]|nr:hypothetical protein [Richelia sp. CSU_2_1]
MGIGNWELVIDRVGLRVKHSGIKPEIYCRYYPPECFTPTVISNQCYRQDINCQLSTVNCQLSTVNCQLSTI